MRYGLAPISHTRWCLRRFKKPTEQEPRAVRCGPSDKCGDAPCRLSSTGPSGCLSAGIFSVGRLNRIPDTLFRRPPQYLPRRKRNAGAMECEKWGLGIGSTNRMRRVRRTRLIETETLRGLLVDGAYHRRGRSVADGRQFDLLGDQFVVLWKALERVLRFHLHDLVAIGLEQLEEFGDSLGGRVLEI